MENLLKKINILGEELSYYEENNKRKKTIMFIHGFNSSVDFIKNIVPLKKKFNVIAINLPGSKYCPTNKNIKIIFFANIIKEFINKKIKTKKIIVLGHSLGGAVSSYLYDINKVKGIIFMAPLNPSMVNDTKYKTLKKIVFPRNAIDKWKIKAIKSILSISLDPSFVNSFISEDSHFINIVKEEILSKGYMEVILDDNFRLCNQNKKTYYLIGKKDKIINPKLFNEYVTQELNKTILYFDNSMHNIIKNQPEDILSFLNETFYSNKTFFKWKLIKN